MLVGGISVDGKLTWYISVDSDSTSKNENDIKLMVRLNIFYVYFYLLYQLLIHITEMLLSCIDTLHIKMIKTFFLLDRITSPRWLFLFYWYLQFSSTKFKNFKLSNL